MELHGVEEHFFQSQLPIHEVIRCVHGQSASLFDEKTSTASPTVRNAGSPRPARHTRVPSSKPSQSISRSASRPTNNFDTASMNEMPR
ncbi:unnamed protein product, partial [Nesidiocoris tenuis]